MRDAHGVDRAGTARDHDRPASERGQRNRACPELTLPCRHLTLRTIADQRPFRTNDPTARRFVEALAGPPFRILTGHVQRRFEGAGEGFADLIAAADKPLMMLGAGSKETKLRLVELRPVPRSRPCGISCDTPPTSAPGAQVSESSPDRAHRCQPSVASCSITLPSIILACEARWAVSAASKAFEAIEAVRAVQLEELLPRACRACAARGVPRVLHGRDHQPGE